MKRRQGRSAAARPDIIVPRAHMSEPAEREHPLNVALDAVEQLVTNIVAEGGEAPLRARLRRLLPTTDPQALGRR